MSWHSAAEFLHMGGYAVYVWGSVAATALVAVVEVALLRRCRREWVRRIAEEWESAKSVAPMERG
ncbi:heme exporter protein CcmD [Candidatus Symbiobacter mobilis]|uniref:heme exporter protein CcmD n=1 Tax=Candidatus Symbiobacter mobilis TaxID=1436290 RepID=UPI00059BA34C|nr:heme exporter protein CcmD [Candidatus Symbiobacter mobilis]